MPRRGSVAKWPVMGWLAWIDLLAAGRRPAARHPCPDAGVVREFHVMAGVACFTIFEGSL